MHSLAALRQTAMAARASSDHAAAVQAWHTLLDAAPDDWTLALELKHDLQAGLHNPDSDPRFRRAARRLPDAAWVAHYAASPALPASELDDIDRRARALLSRVPPDPHLEPSLEALLGHVARQRRAWPEAACAFAAAQARDPAHPDWPRLAAEARLYTRLAATPLPTSAEPDYELTLINMDRNPERLADLLRACEGFPVAPVRLPAIDGSQLAATAIARLTGDPASPRGTLGCFLSHAAAWDRLLAGTAPCALILEDDALPLLELPSSIAALGLPTGWDVVWVNDRMQPPHAPLAATFTTKSAHTILQSFAPWHDAVGADGYLVSRAGARKLLDWVAADGLAGDVDWRMLAYAITPTQAAALPRGSASRRLLDAIPQPPRPDRLAAYALQPALVREVSLSSDRQDTDRNAKSPTLVA